MKIIITKKEFEALNSLTKDVCLTLAKDRTLDIIDEDDIQEFDLDKFYSNGKFDDKWGKVKIYSDKSKVQKKIDVNIESDFVVDCINLLYHPIVIRMVKWVISTYKVFAKMESDFAKGIKKLTEKWI